MVRKIVRQQTALMLQTKKEYFVPTRKAESRNGMVGICDGANEFSGNFMNWATMTAIDVFRQAMTGGNRAIGIKNDRDAYTSGDTATQTFLRRANIVRLQNRNNMIREADLTDAEIKLVLPHDYASDVTAPYLIRNGREAADNKFFLYKGYIPHPYAWRTNGGFAQKLVQTKIKAGPKCTVKKMTIHARFRFWTLAMASTFAVVCMTPHQTVGGTVTALAFMAY